MDKKVQSLFKSLPPDWKDHQYGDVKLPKSYAQNAKNWAEGWLNEFVLALQFGLPRCYEGQSRSFLIDHFSGDLPWGATPNHDRIIYLIRKDARWPVIKLLWQEKYGEVLDDPITSDEYDALVKAGVKLS